MCVKESPRLLARQERERERDREKDRQNKRDRASARAREWKRSTFPLLCSCVLPMYTSALALFSRRICLLQRGAVCSSVLLCVAECNIVVQCVLQCGAV